MLNKDLIDEYIIEKYKIMSKCECFEDGQEFLIEPNLAKAPEGFCQWAWAEIRNDINLIASGGNILGLKPKRTAIQSCIDWFRSVYFKIQRIE
jgi:uncharacterized repeat protein (TIGR04076 family)